MSNDKKWKVHNPHGDRRVVVTKGLPGVRWLEILIQGGCRVDVCTLTDILSIGEISSAIDDKCSGVIGQLTEVWGDELFSALENAGGKVYSNYAVGYNNVDV
ncbi:MAG: hypothetical protein U9R20_06660, partial [Thermodesulfobacteriota bacterium]|nr:hypothetical protein [Thermodesulfobacteriota bacterium]